MVKQRITFEWQGSLDPSYLFFLTYFFQDLGTFDILKMSNEVRLYQVIFDMGKEDIILSNGKSNVNFKV